MTEPATPQSSLNVPLAVLPVGASPSNSDPGSGNGDLGYGFKTEGPQLPSRSHLPHPPHSSYSSFQSSPHENLGHLHPITTSTSHGENMKIAALNYESLQTDEAFNNLSELISKTQLVSGGAPDCVGLLFELRDQLRARDSKLRTLKAQVERGEGCVSAALEAAEAAAGRAMHDQWRELQASREESERLRGENIGLRSELAKAYALIEQLQRDRAAESDHLKEQLENSEESRKDIQQKHQVACAELEMERMSLNLALSKLSQCGHPMGSLSEVGNTYLGQATY